MQWRRVWGRQGCVWGVLAFSAWLTPVHADVAIQGAGATFPSRVYDRWTARFMAERPGPSIRYQGTGSGDGIRQAKARTVHFGGTDNPLSVAQLAEHKLVQIPLLVGGTMLYFKALLEGLSPLPSADPAIRAEIEAEAARLGWQALHDELVRIDPVAGARIHPNDPQRLSRALEVYRISGKTLTELTQVQGEGLPYRVHQFAIAPSDRAVLHQRIELRFDKMLQGDFEQEVRALYERGDLHPDLPAIRCVGYRQMWDYLAGEVGYDEMRYRGIVATRQLAKRQMTWLRGWTDLTWLESGESGNVARVVARAGAA